MRIDERAEVPVLGDHRAEAIVLVPGRDRVGKIHQLPAHVDQVLSKMEWVELVESRIALHGRDTLLCRPGGLPGPPRHLCDVSTLSLEHAAHNATSEIAGACRTPNASTSAETDRERRAGGYDQVKARGSNLLPRFGSSSGGSSAHTMWTRSVIGRLCEREAAGRTNTPWIADA